MADEIKLSFPLFTTTDNPDSKPGERQKFSLFRVAEWVHPEMKATDGCMALFTSQTKAEMFIRENPSVIGPIHGGVAIASASELRTLLTKLKAKNPDFAWVGI